MADRRFPLLIERTTGTKWRGPTSVPWSLVEAHESQARENHDQTLEMLARRGGLDPSELLAVLSNMRYREMERVYPTREERDAAALALIDHDGAIRTEARATAIRECAALARQRADELQRNDGHRAAGEVIELRGIARDMEELLEAAHRAARPTGEGGDTNDENRPPREG